jgi:hypothetical protein
MSRFKNFCYLCLVGLIFGGARVGAQSSPVGPTQTDFECCYVWSAGEPISFNSVGSIPLNQAPITREVKACEGEDINFSIRFWDVDMAKCSKRESLTQFPNADYQITFTSSDVNATFQNGTNLIKVEAQFISPLPNPYDKTKIVDVFVSENVILKVLPSIILVPITVTATIKEIVPTLEECNTGNPTDPDATFSWVVIFNSNPPEKLTRSTLIPLENTWSYYAPPRFDGLGFVYKALTAPPPAYKGVLVHETFESVSAGGLFTMDDILPAWRLVHPMMQTPDAVAMEIFNPGNPFSFDLSASHEFEDFHGGWALKSSVRIDNVFTKAAIDNKRVGYKLDQSYKSCGVDLGTAEIWRRIDNKNKIELKKKHSL